MSIALNKNVRSVRFNVFFNTIRILFNFLFPLIIFPHISRALGVEKLGIFTYSTSIINYYAYISALGIDSYAVREGAKYFRDTEKVENFVGEVFTTNLLTTTLAYFLLALSISLTDFKSDRNVLFTLSLTIFCTTIGVEWLNHIYENYLYITIRTIIIRLFSLVLILLFIKSPEDIHLYAIITVATSALTSSINLFYCRKFCKFKLILNRNVIHHLKYMLIFFANNLAILIYVNSDVTMLGYFVDEKAVGLYSISAKIYGIIKNTIASMYLVSIPRLTKYLIDSSRYEALLNKIIQGLLLLIIPISVWLFFLSHQIVMLISGYQYIRSVNSLRILSFSLLFAILGGVMTQCILIPNGKEKTVLVSTILAAIINVVMNLFLIPIMKQDGAALTTLIAEMCVPITVCVLSKIPRKIFNISFITSLCHATLGSFICFITIRVVLMYVKSNLIVVLLSMSLSIVFYAFILLLFKNEIALEIFNYIKQKFK